MYHAIEEFEVHLRRISTECSRNCYGKHTTISSSLLFGTFNVVTRRSEGELYGRRTPLWTVSSSSDAYAELNTLTSPYM